MSFKKKFQALCNQKGVSPTRVCIDIGLSNAVYTQWTDSSLPRRSTLKKLSEYFDVPIEYWTDDTEPTADDELTVFLEELKNRPEMRMLFSLAKGATKEDVERAVAIIEALKNSNPDG